MICHKAGELACARARLYQLLGTLYFIPHEPELLKFVASWSATQLEAGNLTKFLSRQMRDGLNTMLRFFEERKEESWDELLEIVSVEFTRLFRGVKQHYSPPPPYESVYCESLGCVFGESTTAVLKEYRRFGFDLVDELRNEPPDYLGFELEFMHLLCRAEARAWEQDKRDEAVKFVAAERKFVEKHLLTWLPLLCSKVREYDRIGFFRALADLTEGWVSFDYEQHLSNNSAGN